MDALDGNAIAGELYEFFGTEMTAATGICRRCARASVLAELHVYTRAPGAVARCPHCGSVVMVIVDVGVKRIHHEGLELPG